MRMLPALAGITAATALSLPGVLSSAAAAPRIPFGAPVKWSAKLGPVPTADTHTTPALAAVSLPGSKTRRLLFWTSVASPKASMIFYQTSVRLRRNQWTAPKLVDAGKATTEVRPAAAPLGPTGSGEVIVAWTKAGGSSILYSIGKAGTGTTLTWGAAAAIPGTATADGPAVYSALDSDAVIVVWKNASSDLIDFVVGIPHGTAVKWGKIGVIPGATTTTTPAVAEANTGKHAGAIYVLWEAHAGRIDFAVAADPLPTVVKWSPPRSLPSYVSTSNAPSAQAIGKGLTLPLLIVYEMPGGPKLAYVALSAKNTVTRPFEVPGIQSTNGTTIIPGVLAAQAPGPLSPRLLGDPSNIFYEPFVRPCAGC
jgi:hypothetical protein